MFVANIVGPGIFNKVNSPGYIQYEQGGEFFQLLKEKSQECYAQNNFLRINWELWTSDHSE